MHIIMHAYLGYTSAEHFKRKVISKNSLRTNESQQTIMTNVVGLNKQTSDYTIVNSR